MKKVRKKVNVCRGGFGETKWRSGGVRGGNEEENKLLCIFYNQISFLLCSGEHFHEEMEAKSSGPPQINGCKDNLRPSFCIIV